MKIDSNNSPIIIVGAARSGTKFLRDVLASGPHTATVPYDVSYVWRGGVNLDVHDVLDPKSLTPKRRKVIQKALSKLARQGPEDVLIEKTVANTLRIPFVNEVFPQARFVHLTRNGVDVTESSLRQWKAPPNWRNLFKKLREMPLRNFGYVVWFAFNTLRGVIRGNKGGNVWGPRYPGIEADTAKYSTVEVCALQWRHCVETARQDLAQIESERTFTIRYEDLVNNPEALRVLIRDLGLPEPDAILSAYKERVNPTLGTGKSRLNEADFTSIRPILEPTMKKLGYSL